MTQVPSHWIHIYERPPIGNHLITRRQAFKYQHQKLAVGGDDTMSCEIPLNKIEAEIAAENWIGSRVAVFVEDAAQPVWEGLITRTMVSVGGLMVSRSLDNMFNRVAVNLDIPAGFFQTAFHDETDSQAQFGIKTGVADGYAESASNPTHFNYIRDLIIAQNAWPLTTIVQSDGGANLARIECKGFYHTIKWENNYNAALSTATPSAYVTNLIAALDNTDTFLDYTDTTLIESNTGYTIYTTNSVGRSIWQDIQRALGGGDGTNYWVAGVARTSPVTGTRRFYYRAANTTVEYTARLNDGLRVRNLYGGLVRPWNVCPDRGIRIQDLMVGWGGRGLDPRETYIETIRYDADRQRVTWTGADDLYMQGALQIHRYYKMHDTIFGAQPRQAWT